MSNFVALIVEDDPFQRECLADLLKSEGLEVLECANGEVAELVLATTGTELRALVTDVQLGGGMSGVELAQYAKRQFPDLNVVMVSGHGPPNVPDDTHFLLKPYGCRRGFVTWPSKYLRPSRLSRARLPLNFSRSWRPSPGLRPLAPV